jgi:hypothetical protein
MRPTSILHVNMPMFLEGLDWTRTCVKPFSLSMESGVVSSSCLLLRKSALSTRWLVSCITTCCEPITRMGDRYPDVVCPNTRYAPERFPHHSPRTNTSSATMTARAIDSVRLHVDVMLIPAAAPSAVSSSAPGYLCLTGGGAGARLREWTW